jgi:hypothetical protein
LPADLDAHPRRKLFEFGDLPFDIFGNRAQISSFDVGIDLDEAWPKFKTWVTMSAGSK